MTTDIKLPLTSSSGSNSEQWSQREFVACVQQGFRFTAHGSSKRDICRKWFHYNLGDRCVSLLVNIAGDPVVRRVDHKFKPTLDWIEQCRKETKP